MSGLRQVQEILDGVSDIHFTRLTSQDVVRHRLVGEIVDAYERYEGRVAEAGPGNGRRGAGVRRGRSGSQAADR